MRKKHHAPGPAPLQAAMAAHQAGRLPEADRLYRQAIEADPGNARALRLRGILARETGDLQASGQLLARAAEVAPASGEPLAELAVTRMAEGDLRGAERSLRGALQREPKLPKALANLGALLQYRGHIVAAIGWHRQALELDPADVEVRCNLARALVEAGEGAEALRLCEEGLAALPGHPALLGAKGGVLSDLGEFAAAAAVLEGAVLRDPDDDMAWLNLGHVRTRLGQHEKAIEALRAARRANPDGGRATADLVNLLSGTGRGAEALALAEGFLVRHPGERHVLAALGFALRDAGREAQARALVDLGRFIRVIEPEAPRGYASIAEFNAALRALVESDASLLAGPASKATRGGLQTGEFAFDEAPVLQAFHGMADQAVRAVAAAFAAEGLAQHPLMAGAERRWNLRAWATVLGSGGCQAPHIHPLGWVSAVYYVHLPADMGAAGGHPGWIEFGAPPERFLVAAPPPTRAVEPRAGRLVVFPSFFYHRTIPFVACERRISIAFDVVPRVAP